MSGQAPGAEPPRGREPAAMMRLSAMFFLHWAMFGVWVPLAGRYMLAGVGEGGLGFTQQQVGWLMGISGTLGALLAPFLGGQIADRYVRTEHLLAALLVVGGVLKWVTACQTTFAAWLLLSIAAGIILAPTSPLSNSLAFAHMSDARHQFPWVRLWGTIGWIVPAYVFPALWLKTGLRLTWKPPFLVGPELPDVTSRLVDSFIVAAVIGFVYAAYCLTLPKTPPKREARERLAVRKALRLFRHRSFGILVGAGLLLLAIHQIYFLQTGQFLKSLGVRDADILPAMSVGQIAEIGVMALLPLMLRRLGFRWVLTIGAAAYLLRFAVFGTTTLPLWAIVASQGLHGVCFACYIATAFIYVNRLADDDIRHSAQTVFGILLGVAPVLGGWLNGRLAAAFTSGGTLDYRGYFYATAAIGLVATLIVALFFRDETEQAQPVAAGNG